MALAPYAEDGALHEVPATPRESWISRPGVRPEQQGRWHFRLDRSDGTLRYHTTLNLLGNSTWFGQWTKDDG